MKNLKMFESFAPIVNESNDKSPIWDKLGPNWLADAALKMKGGKAVGDYITVRHSDLDISIIFFLQDGEIRWNWTWGPAPETSNRTPNTDIADMVAREVREEETLGFGITGETPEDFIKNVDKKISKVEAARLKAED